MRDLLIYKLKRKNDSAIDYVRKIAFYRYGPTTIVYETRSVIYLKTDDKMLIFQVNKKYSDILEVTNKSVLPKSAKIIHTTVDIPS